MSESILPQGWTIRPMKEVIKWASGGTPKSTVPQYYNGTIPWLIIADLNNSIIRESTKKISELGLQNSSAKLIPKDTLLVAMYGSIGKLGITGIECASNQAIAFAKEIKHTNTKFMFYYFMYIKSELYRLGKGGTQRNISLTVLNSLSVSLPQLPEQERILEKVEELFSELDKAVEELEKVKQQLKIYRQAVLKAAFEGKLTGDSLGKKRNVMLLKNLFLIAPQNGIYKSKDYYGRGTHILRIDGFYDGDILHDYDYKRVNICDSDINKYKLQIDDIVINRVNSLPYLGKCGLVNHLCEDTVFESNIMRLTIDKNKALVKYVSLYLSSLIGLKELRKNAKHAVNQASINQNDVSNVKIILPDLITQQNVLTEIESRISVCDKIEDTVEASLKKAESLRQSILKKAFEGKLV